uniref:Beta-defensin-like protein n=1 Tax=Phalotris mertensi TaxID=1260334 RepID=A0A2K8FKU6_9SAUR|nr:beta-defensin-like protein [Phalotris mertensi]
MKILYLLFALLFLAFLSEPGNAQFYFCVGGRGRCYSGPCPRPTTDIGNQNCPGRLTCCVR